MLDGSGSREFANAVEPLQTRVPVVTMYADLDQFVGLERPLDFGKHSGCEAVVADHDNGFEGVRERLQFSAIRR